MAGDKKSQEKKRNTIKLAGLWRRENQKKMPGTTAKTNGGGSP